MKSSDVKSDLAAGKASLHVKDLHLFDYFKIPNALFRFMNPVRKPATVSFKLDWIGPATNRHHLNNPALRFEGDFLESPSRMEWSAHREDGFSFVSDAAATSTNIDPAGKKLFSGLGSVRNGVFFEGDEGD